MLERLKDFLYDISDIVVSLLIIAIIFFSVSWKISDTLSFDLEAMLPSGSETEAPLDDDKVIEIIPNTNLNHDLGTDTENSNHEAQPEDTTPTEPTGDNDTTTPPDTSAPSDTSTPAAYETFVVPSGASGYSIGEDLAALGYVDSANTFVSRLVERELDRKLFAGDFKLSKSDDLDTIINVLTGQGR
ncbi:hypothetical protein KHM83_02315 [Fusibacter paucivorans]|uniref:YceG-like family protein n=1 Tax=Fusibacter paucivorans TaxID=76009 RepID=A0ABS5PK79_9FIRM|nr:hypothetical protein [Fusibacter paucivorans]MBS7525509.1 hypothetical protein [Fusibacter paucivorans]